MGEIQAMVARRPASLHPLVGFLALFSGVALLLNILAEVSLPTALVATSAAVVLGLARIFLTSTGYERRAVARTLALAAISGTLATVTYDAAKAFLSQADPSPYNPFEAIRVFGTLLLGPASTPALILAGASFHLLNGTCFGIAYTFLFGSMAVRSRRSALISGMGWGVFLETFQLTLYPGWLDIRFYQEFATISALSHLVYGATLALLVRALLRRQLSADPPAFQAVPMARGGKR